MSKKKRSKRKTSQKAVAPVKKPISLKQIIIYSLCAIAIALLTFILIKTVFYKRITRAELADMLSTSLSASGDTDLSSFSDVNVSSKYYAGLQAAYEMRLFDVENGLLEPNKRLTNEEAYSMISRAFLLYSNDASSLNYIKDSDDISDKYKYDLSGIVGDGYVDKGKIHPQKKASYKDIEKIIKKIEGYVVIHPDQAPKGNIHQGNLYVKTDGVALKDMDLIGHLIVTEAPGASIELDNVKVKGKIIIRSTENSSVVMKNNSTCAGVYAIGTGGGVLECDETSPVKLNSAGLIKVRAHVTMAKILSGGYVIMDGTLDNAQLEGGGTVMLNSGSFDGIYLYGDLCAAVIGENASGNHVAASSTASGSCIDISGKVTKVSCEAKRCAVILGDTAEVTDVTIYENSDNSSLKTLANSKINGTIKIESNNISYSYSGEEKEMVITGENFKKEEINN